MSALFNSYRDYMDYQKKNAQKTVNRTLEFTQYSRITHVLKAFFPKAESVLLIGCRHRIEYDIFRRHYPDVTAIDLFEDGPIIHCDMSKISQHRQVGSRKYDVFVSIRSLAHCIDFKGFLNGFKSHASQGIYCFTKAGYTVNKWFCSEAEILRTNASPALFEEVFNPFRLHHLQYQWNQDEYNVEFVCRR